jgi:hypothetical protein
MLSAASANPTLNRILNSPGKSWDFDGRKR